MVKEEKDGQKERLSIVNAIDGWQLQDLQRGLRCFGSERDVSGSEQLNPGTFLAYLARAKSLEGEVLELLYRMQAQKGEKERRRAVLILQSKKQQLGPCKSSIFCLGRLQFGLSWGRSDSATAFRDMLQY